MTIRLRGTCEHLLTTRALAFSIIILQTVSHSIYATGGNMGNGSGTVDDPYLIEDFADFQTFTEDPNYWASEVYIQLTCDLDLEPTLPGRQTYARAVIAYDGTSFEGHFQGNGYVITNLCIDIEETGSENLGLFGAIVLGTVNDIGVKNCSITGGNRSKYLAGLCGRNHFGTISNCYSMGLVSGGHYSAYVGGLCGSNDWGSTITHCYSTGSVTCGGGSEYLGGLCGSNSSHSTLIRCYSTADVSGSIFSDRIGGLCGENQGTITNSHATGSITCGIGANCLGGLCGKTEFGDITSCYSIGSVTGGPGIYLGGLCGENDRSRITTCYSTGPVIGEGYSVYLGGLCGYNAGTITSCYSASPVSGGDESRELGGLCGYNWFNEITTCYSTGRVTGGEDSSNLGGLCGNNDSGSITGCFWDVETSGIGSAGDNNFGSIGKNTIDMQTLTTYINAGWDFFGETVNGSEDIWQIRPGEYPSYWHPFSGGGSGDSEDPFKITCLNDLLYLNEHTEYWDRYFTLASDMDLENYSFTQAVIAPNDLVPFRGYFDGDHHCIRNLRITDPNTDYMGLFGVTGVNTVIKNLTLVNSQVAGALYTGSLVGKNHGQVQDCSSTGTVCGTDVVGGLVGENRGSIRNSYSWIDVNGSTFVGGLVGDNQAEIYHCYSIGTTIAVSFYGNFVGRNDGTVIGSLWHDPNDPNPLDPGALGWNTESIWCLGPDVKPYPIFQWQQIILAGLQDPIYQWQIETWRDFEQGFGLGWDFYPVGSTSPWTITSNEAYAGNHSACAGVIGQSSILEFTRDCPEGQIRFLLKVSFEGGGRFIFYDNGFTRDEWQWDSNQDWCVFYKAIDPGIHTFSWKFTKEGETSADSDQVWIDDVMIIAQ